jgi:hypothetical protein
MTPAEYRRTCVVCLGGGAHSVKSGCKTDRLMSSKLQWRSRHRTTFHRKRQMPSDLKLVTWSPRVEALGSNRREARHRFPRSGDRIRANLHDINER